jgi:YidC/Oxa1 family membrane protein insertase
MDRNALLRISLIILAGLLFWKFGSKGCGGEHKSTTAALVQYTNAKDFDPDRVENADAKPVEGELCVLEGPRYRAEFSGRGAALVHYAVTDGHYANGPEGMELGTTPDHERFRSLRTLFRGPGADTQFEVDRFNWKKVQNAPAGTCSYSYADDRVAVTKTFKPTERPYEIAVETTIKNLAAEKRGHQFQIGAYAFRYNDEIKGKLGRVSPNVTDLSCAKGDEITHKAKDDFKDGPFTVAGADRYMAVSTAFFAQAIVPQSGTADCVLNTSKFLGPEGKDDEDRASAVYEGRLVYPTKELAPQESATYGQTVYYGPKDRVLLPLAIAGKGQLGGLITYSSFLGLPLAPVAKILVGGLTFFYGKVGNWGIAIMLLTIALKLCLLPLALPGIKNSIKLRKIKPELDELKKKYPDDMQARQLATMELHKKHGVSMVTGCLPQLATMPIWVAMYSTIQTAVEFYHVKFLWFGDLSLPDRFYILPLLLGGFMLLHTKVVPQQAEMDPTQQKMMTFMMPVVFTVMMLFLPAALGVYMLTNSVLNILQTLGVEAYARRAVAAAQSGEIVVKSV